MKVFIASDHAGFALKQSLLEYAKENSALELIDLGPQSTASVDYPDFAHLLCEQVATQEGALGVLVCGTGIGMSMVANRHSKIRAALCYNSYAAQMARAHNNANVLCLGERVIGQGLAEAIFDRFIEQPFEGGRHQRRIDKFGIE
ncbi:MAG: ribose 5-phosphate isomerase B [Myxococcales bacterium]|nr:MAG: ribose 5-phosphate isomerase B [Myxococcales bacterium]